MSQKFFSSAFFFKSTNSDPSPQKTGENWAIALILTCWERKATVRIMCFGAYLGGWERKATVRIMCFGAYLGGQGGNYGGQIFPSKIIF